MATSNVNEISTPIKKADFDLDGVTGTVFTFPRNKQHTKTIFKTANSRNKRTSDSREWEKYTKYEYTK